VLCSFEQRIDLPTETDAQYVLLPPRRRSLHGRELSRAAHSDRCQDTDGVLNEPQAAFPTSNSPVEVRNTEVSGDKNHIADRNRQAEHNIWLVGENSTRVVGRYNRSPLARHNTHAEVCHSCIPVDYTVNHD
jgi:hypothetical protein